MVSVDDLRYVETFYGIHTDDWNLGSAFGTFLSTHNKFLTKNYKNEGCECTETSKCTDTDLEFLYPHLV